MIEPDETQFCIGSMCRLLSVSRSDYYGRKQRPPSDRNRANQLLVAEIKRVFDDEKGRPGAPRIARRLQDEGKAAGRHRVARIMQDNGWRAKAARKYKATTHSKHSLPVAPKLLEQHFSADRPNQKWVSDITYIWTDEGWRSCRRFIPGGPLAGRSQNARRQRGFVMPLSWRYGTERCQRV